MNKALFLDRDGVINVRKVGAYVCQPDEFVLIDGVLEALETFSRHFSRIFVVTNQQGIGKGLMSQDDLASVHQKFLTAVKHSGGRIDKIYFCPELESSHSFNRKPNIGMAIQARKDFPEINLHRSIMIGDTLSDMRFGKRAGMETILVGEEPELALKAPHLVDKCYQNLLEYSKTL